MALTASLGFWQLGRAAQKEALQAQRDAREGLPALGWSELRDAASAPGAAAALADLHDRSVLLQGRWVPEATVFLDNRTMNGRAGFYVVTPLRPVGEGAAILVQRGWVARRFDDRLALPAIDTPDGVVELTGRLAPPPSKYYQFEGAPEGAIRQNIELDAFSAEWRVPLLPASIQQTAPQGAADGMLRDWPRVGLDVHKHYGYAFQWFGLCALIAFLYVWFQFIAPRRRSAA
ncbi:SURF1 family protein [Hydrogenophaga aquatica]